MQVIFLGAEDQTDRNFLLECGVTDLGVNYFDLGLKQQQEIVNLPEEVHVHLYAGAMPKGLTERQQQELVESYEQYIDAHSDVLWTWSETRLPGSEMEQHREQFFNRYDPFRFRPIFHEADSMFDLEALSDMYPHVLLTREAVSLLRETADRDSTDDPLLTLSREHGTTFHATGMHRARQNVYNFASVATAMWQAPRRFGQPVVWDGRKLIRSATANWDEALEKHYARIKSYGINADAIISGDRTEAMRLAVVSLLEYQKACERTPGLASTIPVEDSGPLEEVSDVLVADISNTSGGPPEGETAGSAVAVPVNKGRGTRKTTSSKPTREQGLFPMVAQDTMTSMVMGTDGPEMRELPLLESAPAVRHCDICVLSRQCPQFSPGDSCAFGLPVELKTREQIMALMQTVMEMQSARVFFARFQEELSGGALDEATSKEIDRLVRLALQLKAMDEVKETVSLTVERKSSAGVLSAIFGRGAAVDLLPDDGPPPAEVSDS